MTVRECIDALVNEYYMEDWVYHVREQARETRSEDEKDLNSWDLPKVKRYEEICKTLKTYLEHT